MISDPYGPTIPPLPTPIRPLARVQFCGKMTKNHNKNGLWGILVLLNHVLLAGGASTLGVSPSYP